MICTMNCFECPFPDCITNPMTAEHRAALDRARKKYRNSPKGKAKEKEQNKRYYREHKAEIIARVMERRKAANAVT